MEHRWVGRVLRDKWRIDSRIARGGVGSVFAATHKNNGSTAAIKILHAQFSRDHDTRSRFLQEGYAANQVNHPGVVRILDDDVTEEGLAYLVMELLEGELLEQRRIRKGGRLSLSEVYDVADQLLDVLAAAHAKGIVHRDIKPDNIFLTKQGRLKVLDFGFAQMKSGFRTEQTATGFLLGTPGFMAPEQAVGDRPLIDAQTDIWAVGATLFILLTGQPVHDGESAAEMLVAAANYPARSISTLEPGLPTKLMAAVDRALAFQKRDRWPDARSMQTALRNVPGRPPVANPDPARAKWGKSIPDDRQPPTLPAGFGGATGMESIEEISVEHVISGSGETAAYVHPADLDEPGFGDAPTVLARSPRADLAMAFESETKDVGVLSARRLPNLDDFPPPETTELMEARPRSGGYAPPVILTPRGSRPDGFLAPQPRGSRPDAFLAPQSRGSRPDGFLAPQSRGAPFIPNAPSSDPQLRKAATDERMPLSAPTPRGPSAASRVLVFLLVTGITMVIVILTGLLVILGTD